MAFNAIALPFRGGMGRLRPALVDDARVHLGSGGASLLGFDFARLRGRGHVVGYLLNHFERWRDEPARPARL
jgi:hypothetical protein